MKYGSKVSAKLSNLDTKPTESAMNISSMLYTLQ